MKFRIIIIQCLSFFCINCGLDFSGSLLDNQNYNTGIPAIIASQIRDRTYSVNDIYVKFVKEDTLLKGNITLKIFVLPDGKVSGVYIDTTDIKNMLFKLEIMGLVRQWRFSNVIFKGDPIIVKYAFNFYPHKKEE